MKLVNTPYDDVFRTLLNDCTELIIPVVNEIFGENYNGNEPVIFFQNEHFLNQQDGNTNEKITDSCFEIQGAIRKKYHIECQSAPDGSLAIRFFEYDSQIALDNGELTKHCLEVTYPHSAVLYLRHTSRTPDAMTIRINTPGGSISYQIPVLKTQQYSIDEIFEKNMLFLIPFYIFSYEKNLGEYDTDSEKMEELKKQYFEIRNRLDTICAAGIVNEYTKCTIIDMSRKVLEHLAAHYTNVRKGVISVMGGHILEHEAKTILNRGIQAGKKEGIREGKKEGIREGKKEGIREGIQAGKKGTLLELVRDGLLTVEEAAKRLQMNEHEFKKLL
ncbi:MAG: hypothetical protein Q4C91_23885 [Eubacteriales bacterium]|nr:hypothetical protein [Eubacteriales bacterium]